MSICAAPFIPLANATGLGALESRYCMFGCCIGCPFYEYLYPQVYEDYMKAAFWLGWASEVFTIFLLLSFIFLPREASGVNALNFSYVSAVFLQTLLERLPQSYSKETICADEITPNNAGLCLATGAVTIYGLNAVSMATVVRCFMILYEMFLRKPIRNWAYYIGLGSIQVVSIVFMIVSIVVGAIESNIFNFCFVKLDAIRSFLMYPILVYTVPIALTQIVVTGYSAIVLYQSRAIPYERSISSATSGQKSMHIISSMVRTQRKRRTVIMLFQQQWRFMLFTLAWLWIALSYVFIADQVYNKLQAVATVPIDFNIVQPWVACLTLNNGDYKKCAPAEFMYSYKALLYAYYLPSVEGILICVMFLRWRMVTGWGRRFVDLYNILTCNYRRQGTLSESSTEENTFSYQMPDPGQRVGANGSTMRSPFDSSMHSRQMSEYTPSEKELQSEKRKEIGIWDGGHSSQIMR